MYSTFMCTRVLYVRKCYVMYMLCIRMRLPIRTYVRTALPFDGTNDSLVSAMSEAHGVLDSLGSSLGWEDCGVHSCMP